MITKVGFIIISRERKAGAVRAVGVIKGEVSPGRGRSKGRKRGRERRRQEGRKECGPLLRFRDISLPEKDMKRL